MMPGSRIVFQLLLALFVLECAAWSGFAASALGFELRSPAIEPGSVISSGYTCVGADASPPLRWSSVPPGTRSFALIVDDPDAPRGRFTHWVVYNLPAAMRSLEAGVARGVRIGSGGLQGINDFGRIGYNGPCPPPGRPHHYHFRIFALENELKLAPGATASTVRSRMKGHLTGRAELEATFGR